MAKNYKPNIVNNIGTQNTKQEIINILGDPTFEDDKYDFIGYKGNDIYLFYNNQNEISIYKVEKEEKEFSKYIDGCMFVNQYYIETRYPNENIIKVTCNGNLLREYEYCDTNGRIELKSYREVDDDLSHYLYFVKKEKVEEDIDE